MCHWDIKPDNLMFDENDEMKLVDFGTSKIIKGIKDKCDDTEHEEYKSTTSTGF